MSSFTQPLVVKVLDSGKRYELVEEFEYYRDYAENVKYKVPAGFQTNFASIPRIFWRIYPPFGKYTKAAVLHDYFYDKSCPYTQTRKAADKIFLEALNVCGCYKITQWIFYYSVRAFGWASYKK